MSFHFTLLELFYISFVVLGQFLFIPALAGGLILVANRGKQKVTEAIALLIVLISPLLALQILLLPFSFLPAPFEEVASRTFSNLLDAGLPFWFFVAGLVFGVVAILLPREKIVEKVLRSSARTIGIISIGLLVIDGSGMIISRINERVQPQPFVISPLDPKPQYYLPGRPIKNMTQLGKPLLDGPRLSINYRDQAGQTVTLTETTNTSYVEGLGCSDQDLESKSCTIIGKSPDGKNIIGKEGTEYVGPEGTGHSESGYENVRTTIGTTLFEIDEPVTDDLLQDDFVNYFASFKRVGKSQIR